MKNLSSHFNNIFKIAISAFGFLLWTSLLILILFWGWFSGKSNLIQNLNQLASIVSTIIYDKNGLLLNQYFDSLKSNSVYTYLKVTSKINASVIYETSFSKKRFISEICIVDQTSDIILVEGCSQLVSDSSLILLTIITFFSVVFMYLFNKYFFEKASRMIGNISNELVEMMDDSLKIESPRKLKFVEVENLKMLIKNKTNQISVRFEDRAMIKVSQRVAHDLRSPLAVILNILKTREINQENLKVLLSSANRLNEISNNLLDSRKESLQILPKKIRYNLSSGISDTIKNKCIEYTFLSAHDSFSLDCPDIDLWINPTGLERILSNIVNNSIESTEDVFIRFTVVNRESDIEIIILDNGPGYPNNIIKAFQNGIEKTTKLNGHGIGLGSIKEEVLKLGGSICISNGESGGAITRINLPHSLVVDKSIPIILIDDDKYIRYSWQVLAHERKMVFISFSDFFSFKKICHSLSPLSEIYIDSNLENGIKGEDCVHELINLGFSRISLQTGEKPHLFENILGLNDIKSKQFPY